MWFGGLRVYFRGPGAFSTRDKNCVVLLTRHLQQSIMGALVNHSMIPLVAPCSFLSSSIGHRRCTLSWLYSFNEF